jgi:pumilio RNA-binding family
LLIETIVYNVSHLINDEHGNFIIQHTVNLRIDEYNDKIFQFIKSNFIPLSKQKFSSNVIDKCILYEDSCMKSGLVDKMLELKCVNELIMDQYGNYGKYSF